MPAPNRTPTTGDGAFSEKYTVTSSGSFQVGEPFEESAEI